MKNHLIISTLLTSLIIFNTAYATGIDLSISNETVRVGNTPFKLLKINLTSKENNEINIKKVIINRGSCKTIKPLTLNNPNNPCQGSINFGQTLNCLVVPDSCNIIEVVVETLDGGEYKFEKQ